MMAGRAPARTGTTLRQHIGGRLRTLRELAGLRNEDLAGDLGVSPATVSRIESGDRLIKRREIDIWFRTTAAPAAAREELTTLLNAGASQITTWQSRVQHGVDLTQVETGELEASAATITVYDHAVVPGLLQIRDYARLVFEMAGVDAGSIAGSVAVRLRRQSILLDQSKTFELLMTEAALWWRPGSIDLQLEQLRQVRAVMALPNVQVGILPLRGQARAIYPEGFQIYGDRADDADTVVLVELITDEVTISEPSSVVLYQQEVGRLRAGALYRDQARALLDRITTDLDAERTECADGGTG
ncbi:helix-turn-helix domain-containing protein [Parafrankia sp. FMc2]|uniref:helix-turn-helix domain-containing protein n=1 Tax=Parafrankia sp. FMc2 TaxID=3233196 RepID=UPI0034D4EED9